MVGVIALTQERIDAHGSAAPTWREVFRIYTRDHGDLVSDLDCLDRNQRLARITTTTKNLTWSFCAHVCVGTRLPTGGQPPLRRTKVAHGRATSIVGLSPYFVLFGNNLLVSAVDNHAVCVASMGTLRTDSPCLHFDPTGLDQPRQGTLNG
jgi:hypothetical protein